MDGTLMNSGTIISNTINHVRLNIGLEPMDNKILLENINNPDINPAEFFYETSKFTPRHTELFEDYYDAHCIESVELYDGVIELLEKLSDDNYTISIATNASSDFARKTTKHLGIYHHFDYIIGYDDVKKPKPQPDMILKTMENLYFDSENTILIGDSHKDLISAQKSNIECLLVNWGFTDHGTNAYNSTKDLYQAIVSQLKK
jgi:phosphoglycolate phosphatase